MSRPDLGIYDGKPESAWERTTRVAKSNPAFTVGAVGFLAIIYYQVKNFKNRPKYVTPTDHVIRTRVFAQGFLVYCLCGAMVFNMGKHYYKKWYGNTDNTLGAEGINEK